MVDGVGRLAADGPAGALEELHPDPARHPVLAGVDGRLQHAPLGREPEAVVDQLRIARHELVLEVGRAPVEHDALQPAPGRQQQRAAGGLIDAARLHADEAVLHQVEPADAVPAGGLVQPLQQRRRREARAVHRHRVAPLEVDLDIVGLVGGGGGRDGAGEHLLVRLDPRVLQRAALIGNVQQVGVGGVGRLAPLAARNRDLARLGIGDQPVAGVQVPFAPGGDHADARLERVIGKLEAHLVVALAGRAVGDGVRAGLARDLDLAPGDQRARDRGAEQILPLIERIGPEHGEDEIAHELLAQVVHIDLLHAHGLGLGAGRLQLLALAEIGREGHDLAAIGLPEPVQDDGGVEAARIGEHHPLDLVAHRASSRTACSPARSAARRSRAVGRRLSDLSWPQAARMSRPRGVLTGLV